MKNKIAFYVFMSPFHWQCLQLLPLPTVETLTHDKQEASCLPDSGLCRWVRNLLILWVIEERSLPLDLPFTLPVPGSDVDLM